MSIRRLADWHTTKYGGITAVLLTKLFAAAKYHTSYDVKIDNFPQHSERVVFVSNHVSKMDPPLIFTAFGFRDLVRIAPVKFLTWHRYYYSGALPFLYLTGCFPTHRAKHSGVAGGVYFANNGYRTFIFPEGKRNPNRKSDQVYEGVSRILESLDNPRLFLVHIDISEFNKTLSVKIREADANIDKKSPSAIMDAIYAL